MGNVKSFCCRDNVSEIDDREERSRILNDNCGTSCDNIYNDSTTSAVSHQDSISYGSINNGHSSKTMEQSALDKIYQKMASNVIDVAPGESMVIQPPEFMERQKAYQAKLNQIKTPLPLKQTNRVPKHVNSSFDTTLNTSSPSTTATNSTLGAINNNNSITTNHNFTANHHLLSANTTSNTANSNSPQHVNKGQEKRGVEYEPISVDDIQLINEISQKSAQAIKNLKITSQEQVVAHFKP